MPKRTFNRAAPYQSIRRAAEITGLAQGYIREGCKNGRIPCLRVGQEYRVCMPLFLRQLEEESAANGNRGTRGTRTETVPERAATRTGVAEAAGQLG